MRSVNKGDTARRLMAKLAGCALVVTVGVLWASPWRLAALRGQARVQDNNRPVRTLPVGTRVTGDPGKKGDTYYWLESQTSRLTARFPDGTIVGERGAGGELRVKVQDRHGNETANFTARSNVVQYVPTVGEPVQAANDSGERPTLDWATRQAYTLSKDGTANLEWKSGLMRSKGAGASPEPLQLDTEWADGLSARVVRKSIARHEIAKGRFVQGDVLLSRLMQGDVEVGTAWLFVQDGVFAWDLPGLTKGWFGPEHLKALYGGWAFTPDMHWLNLQLMASHHFQTLIKARGFVAQSDVNHQRGWSDRVANFFIPTVLADEAGCDGLHWLDGTIYRACCDMHDYCYEKNGCSSKTWWMVWTSWRCDVCNLAVVSCFTNGGGAFGGFPLI